MSLFVDIEKDLGGFRLRQKPDPQVHCGHPAP